MEHHRNFSAALIILAAGQGRRMGSPKCRVQWFGRTFLEWVVQSWRRAVQSSPAIRYDDIIVILPPNIESPSPDIRSPRVRYRVNPDPDSDPFRSIKIGLAHVWFTSPADIVCIWPVDHPGITPGTLVTVFSTIERSIASLDHPGPSSWVWIPTFQGRRGHPVFLHRRMISFLLSREGNWSVGLRSALRALEKENASFVMPIEVDAPSIHWNFNRRNDLHRFRPLWDPDREPNPR